jgi:hypothetical protein
MSSPPSNSSFTSMYPNCTVIGDDIIFTNKHPASPGASPRCSTRPPFPCHWCSSHSHLEEHCYSKDTTNIHRHPQPHWKGVIPAYILAKHSRNLTRKEARNSVTQSQQAKSRTRIAQSTQQAKPRGFNGSWTQLPEPTPGCAFSYYTFPPTRFATKINTHDKATDTRTDSNSPDRVSTMPTITYVSSWSTSPFFRRRPV